MLKKVTCKRVKLLTVKLILSNLSPVDAVYPAAGFAFVVSLKTKTRGNIPWQEKLPGVFFGVIISYQIPILYQFILFPNSQ